MRNRETAEKKALAEFAREYGFGDDGVYSAVEQAEVYLFDSFWTVDQNAREIVAATRDDDPAGWVFIEADGYTFFFNTNI